ncbi:MAG: hypothetical protein IIZ15_01960 [Coriobacteriales bacterium]|nr:hypothetical protein [Coriobacteriales bacterium]
MGRRDIKLGAHSKVPAKSDKRADARFEQLGPDEASGMPEQPAPRRKRHVLRWLLVVFLLLVLLAAGCVLTPVRGYLPAPVQQMLSPVPYLPFFSVDADRGDDDVLDGVLVEYLQRAEKDYVQGAIAVNEQVSLLRTPIFASCGGVDLHVPVHLDDLTEVLFHQGSFPWALSIQTTLPDVDAETCRENIGTHREKLMLSGEDTLNGSVLRLTRPADYAPEIPCDKAIDCGATAGDPVLSPVSGTVVLVRPYRLYEEYPDYRIHIQPDGHPELDVELMHIESPCVQAGDRVIGGLTQIGQVRNLSQYFTNQLEHYTAGDDPGNHTHICVNDKTNPEFYLLGGAAVLDDQGNVIEPAKIGADTPMDEAYRIASGG